MKLADDAPVTTEHVAAPKLSEVAHAIAGALPGHIPVHHGVAKRLTHVTATDAVETSSGEQARVWIRSPFWHFLEYGTRFNPPYRPIQNTVTGLGLPYTPH